MSFSENDKLKALAIVKIFETSRPLGDYAAVAVLNDGAGVSYGVSQFTHRSGSLAAVVERYLASGAQIGRHVLAERLPMLRRTSASVINAVAADAGFKKALRQAAQTDAMRQAQREIGFERYLGPALEICSRREFGLPLSLAVVYDSVTHGSWEYISERVIRIPMKVQGEAREKEWITDYVRKRHRWLTEIRRLRSTNYRTKFFLDQIATGNWQLRLPLVVHGHRLTSKHFSESSKTVAVEPNIDTPDANPIVIDPGPAKTPAADPQARPPAGGSGEEDRSVMADAGEVLSLAANKFDSVDRVVTTVATRKDAAKSLWTTVIGAVSQAAWAVFGFLVGIPREVWIVVAVIAAALMLAYLYRQIVLGKLREMSEPPA